MSWLDGGGPFDAALTAAPAYVQLELARLVPGVAAGELAPAEPVEGWRPERLFAGVAELLDGLARRSLLAVLVEDVHWADVATLDLLTYLMRRAGMARKLSPRYLAQRCARASRLPENGGDVDQR